MCGVSAAVILLHETDPRHGQFDFREIGEAPEFALSAVQPLRPGQVDELLATKDQLRQLGASHESIGWERRDFKLSAVMQQIVKRFEQLSSPNQLVRTASSGAAGLLRTASNQPMSREGLNQ